MVTAAGPSTLTITGTMTNTGPEALTNLTYRFQRGDALRTEADVRQELAEPSEPNAQVQDVHPDVGTTWPRGHRRRSPSPPSSPTRTAWTSAQPGVYPLMVNVNGAVALPAGPLEARIGELHLLLTVMSVPGEATDRPAVTRATPAKPDCR